MGRQMARRRARAKGAGCTRKGRRGAWEDRVRDPADKWGGRMGMCGPAMTSIKAGKGVGQQTASKGSGPAKGK